MILAAEQRKDFSFVDNRKPINRMYITEDVCESVSNWGGMMCLIQTMLDRPINFLRTEGCFANAIVEREQGF